MGIQPHQELHHEIFGSILDQTEMKPFLLQPATDYATSLRQATRMMANRGFDSLGSTGLRTSEGTRDVGAGPEAAARQRRVPAASPVAQALS